MVVQDVIMIWVSCLEILLITIVDPCEHHLVYSFKMQLEDV